MQTIEEFEDEAIRKKNKWVQENIASMSAQDVKSIGREKLEMFFEISYWRTNYLSLAFDISLD